MRSKHYFTTFVKQQQLSHALERVSSLSEETSHLVSLNEIVTEIESNNYPDPENLDVDSKARLAKVLEEENVIKRKVYDYVRIQLVNKLGVYITVQSCSEEACNWAFCVATMYMCWAESYDYKGGYAS